ncbi:hypothetical protein GOODEAATRI_018288, partial [Goodea atripinnis]
VNDNVPFFLSSTYEATVPEGAQIGTSVAQVSATDLDSGLHGMVTSSYSDPWLNLYIHFFYFLHLFSAPSFQIHYTILKDESGDSHYFNIDSRSGTIVTRASFDREQKASYLIEVQSQDGSESSRPGQQGQPNTGTTFRDTNPSELQSSSCSLTACS